MYKTVGFVALASFVFFLAYLPGLADAQVVTCSFCNGTIAKCRVGQICCNGGLKNAACTPNTQTCPPSVQCSQVQCGVDCTGAAVWCPVGQVCCNACSNRNICTLPGGACDQSCPGC